MAELSRIVDFLQAELRVAEISDYAGAHNGLQLQNSGSVTKVAAAVDATLPVVAAAVEQGADLLIVHHGMFWRGVQPITDAFYQKLKLAMDANLAIYSCHLPLDVHPAWGNNVLLAHALGLESIEPFLFSKGMAVGLRGEKQIDRRHLVSQLTKILQHPVHSCLAGVTQCERIGICTGAAGSEVEAAARAGVDTFITGEGPHWSYGLAEELGVNLIYAGHYATETFGVKCVAEQVSSRFAVERCFIDHPTGI